MTQVVDIVNRALQFIGTRTNVSAAELAAGSSNEAIQANLIINEVRDDLLRLAPWNFAQKTANLVWVTSAPGTPENPIAGTTLWQPGQPPPPWNYEYQYPVDCLRVLWIIPATQTGFAGGIPITTAVTGGAASFWQGPPVKFKVMNDQFYAVNGATVAASGAGYNAGDIITLAAPVTGGATIGAPAQLQVLTVNGAGGVLTASVVASVFGETTAIGGNYFSIQSSPVAQGSTNGSGSGATFNLTWTTQAPQRVIVTNQEFAIGTYVQQITDPNLMDSSFQVAWARALGANLAMALTGDKKLANMLVGEVNRILMQTRVNDANEGFTVNDVTPDWIRIRGIDIATPYSSPFTGFDWGGLYPIFG